MSLSPSRHIIGQGTHPQEMSHRYIQEQLCRVQALLLESISMQAILGIIIEDKYQQMISNPHTWGLLPVHTSGSGSRVRQVRCACQLHFHPFSSKAMKSPKPSEPLEPLEPLESAGKRVSVASIDGGDPHLASSIRLKSPKAASQWSTASQIQ